MPALPAALAVLALLASAPVTAQSGLPPADTGGGRHLVLSAGAPVQEHEVRISANTSLALLFDARVQLLRLEGREHFRRVTESEDSLLLMASRELTLGQRLRMPVRVLEGTASTRVDFILVVVPPAQAERQVEVYHARSPESDQELAREEREKARQCQAELARERAERKQPGGLTALIVAKKIGEEGVVTHRMKRLPQLTGEQLTAWRLISYRTTSQGPGDPGMQQPRLARVALELSLSNESARSWLTAGAELVSASGARWNATVWQEAPVEPNARMQRVVVEAELPETEARGILQLELWDEGRTRSVTFGGVSFQ
ncbi:DUF2381 family protein [Archangium sp.]|uniref:DUF2381 family protein n=1 Tax=Archangium sp. TaxID=1872627 RepID=UPI00286CD0BD|nr:DUF2381 family protein [Archangium sp.]